MPVLKRGIKHCPRCNREKPIDHFAKKGPNRLQSWCKTCKRIVSHLHYLANKERYMARKQARRDQLRAWLRSQKKELTCAHCAENHPACLHFHHNDPSTKEINIAATIIMGRSIARVQREIAKCTVLCANCHLKEHWHEYWGES
jgi:transcription elongation factor Elf1